MPESPTAAPDLNRLLACVADDLVRVEAWLEAQLEPPHPRLAPLLDHAARFRGKRMRAAQVLLVGHACGGVTDTHIDVAGIVELIHSSTLAHDDYLDGARQRRHLSCVHVEWGPHVAVLLGDWIYARAFRRSTELPDATCSQVLSDATAKVCAGEIRQNLSRGDFELPVADYVEQIDGKTSALYEASGQLGAYYAGAAPEVQVAAGRHGLLLGRAFQIIDDVLDLAGTESRVGKSLGTDWARRKMTLPLLRLRDALAPGRRARLAEIWGDESGIEVLLEEFGAEIRAALDSVRAEVGELLAEASGCLDSLPKGPARDSLVGMTDFVGTRQK
ncbi:MAG TPA: polyprenyl synthetase family protein [Planctomycetota bacterium]